MKPVSYGEWFVVLNVARRYRSAISVIGDGAERAGALAALAVSHLGLDAQIDAAAAAFGTYERPITRWDGSIG